MQPRIRIRTATFADVPALAALIDVSVRVLEAQDYSPEQLEAALKHACKVETELIADGTYFIAEANQQDTAPENPLAATQAASTSGSLPAIVGCGGWSRRSALFHGDVRGGSEYIQLDPKRDAATIRAFYVHPAWARHGIGSVILAACEDAARAAGFTRCELGATLTGVPLYRARGYVELERVDATLPGGICFPLVHMTKSIAE